jgi:hypothetical protein
MEKLIVTYEGFTLLSSGGHNPIMLGMIDDRLEITANDGSYAMLATVAAGEGVNRSALVTSNSALDAAIASAERVNHTPLGYAGAVNSQAPIVGGVNSVSQAAPVSLADRNGNLARSASGDQSNYLREQIANLQREVARLSQAGATSTINIAAGNTTTARLVVATAPAPAESPVPRSDFSLHDFDVPILSEEAINNIAASADTRVFVAAHAEQRAMIESMQAQIATYTTQLAALVAEEERARLLTTPEGRIVTLRSAIEDVRSMHGVSDVRVRRGTLSNNTVIAISLDTLYSKIENDASRNMGNIVIEIEAVKFISRNTEATVNQWVLILNKTHYHKVNGMRPPSGLQGHAGHVGRDGRACFGGWATPIRTSLKDFDLRSVVVNIIGLIENPNKHDGMGCYALEYPTVMGTINNTQVNHGAQEEAVEDDDIFDNDEHHDDEDN